MKRVLVIIAFVLLAAQSANAQLLWKISGRGIEKPSYILGTHHAVPFTYCDSIPGLMEAFDQVDYVIGEFDMVKMGEMTPTQMQNMQTLAVSKGKSVGGLETMEYQMSLLYVSSLEEQGWNHFWKHPCLYTISQSHQKAYL